MAVGKNDALSQNFSIRIVEKHSISPSGPVTHISCPWFLSTQACVSHMNLLLNHWQIIRQEIKLMGYESLDINYIISGKMFNIHWLEQKKIQQYSQSDNSDTAQTSLSCYCYVTWSQINRSFPLYQQLKVIREKAQGSKCSHYKERPFWLLESHKLWAFKFGKTTNQQKLQ